MLVNPFSNSKLKFLNSDNSDNSISCFNLKFQGGVTSINNYHFTFIDGSSYFGDCVRFLFKKFIYFFFRISKILLVNFSTKIVKVVCVVSL
jgi:hypothetical protein